MIAKCRKNVQRLFAQTWALKRAACIRSRDQAHLCFKIALRHLTSAVVAVFKNIHQRPSSSHFSEDGGRGSVISCTFDLFLSLVK